MMINNYGREALGAFTSYLRANVASISLGIFVTALILSLLYLYFRLLHQAASVLPEAGVL